MLVFWFTLTAFVGWSVAWLVCWTEVGCGLAEISARAADNMIYSQQHRNMNYYS